MSIVVPVLTAKLYNRNMKLIASIAMFPASSSSKSRILPSWKPHESTFKPTGMRLQMRKLALPAPFAHEEDGPRTEHEPDLDDPLVSSAMSSDGSPVGQMLTLLTCCSGM